MTNQDLLEKKEKLEKIVEKEKKLKDLNKKFLNTGGFPNLMSQVFTRENEDRELVIECLENEIKGIEEHLKEEAGQ
jgi:hypothetical protein